MIATHATHEHPATSLARFFDAHRAAYRLMLSTGNICDHSNGRGSATTSQAVIDSQMDEAIRRIREGEAAYSVAADLGINKKTMHARLTRRGLTVRKIRNQ